MCVFWVLKKMELLFFPTKSKSMEEKPQNLREAGWGLGGWGEAGIQRVPTPPVFSPAMDSFPSSHKNHLVPLPLPNLDPGWRRKSCAALCPHPQLPLPAVVLPSWQPSLSALTHSPHENQATASWIILKASEAGRTWQHPACSPSSLSGSHCRFLYKARLSRHPTCPSLLLPALGSMDR